MVLDADDLAEFKAAYPDTPNVVLADMYGITVNQVRNLGSKHKLYKAGRLNRHDYATWIAPVPVRLPAERMPRYKSDTYCRGCGQTTGHWPGCKQPGTTTVTVAAR